MTRSEVRFTGAAPSWGDEHGYCDRCGYTRPPDDLRRVVVPARTGDELKLKLTLCGKCRAALDGEVIE